MPRYSYERLTSLDNSFQALREAAGAVSTAPKKSKPPRSGNVSRTKGGEAPA